MPRGSALLELVQKGTVKPGDRAVLKHKLPAGVNYLHDDDRFSGQVVVQASGNVVIRWAEDGNEYPPTQLATKIIHEELGSNAPARRFPGNMHWGTEEECYHTLWKDR